ncbi:MAG: restriction endonuclease [Candidatus Methanoplasma sp.]|nr:restriction endonuclease [Candidatus Methanoplasma sp.]
MEFSDVLDKYRSEQSSKSDLGTKFEELMSRYLLTDPVYSARIDKVWTWGRFPLRSQLGDHDTGIDIVARTKDGEYWAIQCKCYSEDHRVSKADMDTFISTSGRKFRDETSEEMSFSKRMIIATTDNWSSNATESANNQTIPVIIIGLSILREAAVDWDAIEEGTSRQDDQDRR